jgi:hypothetical protein
MPEPPPFEEPDSAALVQEYRRGQAVPSEAQAEPSPEEQEALPDQR